MFSKCNENNNSSDQVSTMSPTEKKQKENTPKVIKVKLMETGKKNLKISQRKKRKLYMENKYKNN